MSDRNIDIDLTNSTAKNISNIPTDEERSKMRAKLAQVLDRTMTVDRLQVNLPDHLSGYWCPNDSLSIAQAELRGFKVDTEHAHKNGLHDSVDGKAKIADVIFMARPKWVAEEEENIRKQRYFETHIQDRRRQKEERDFEAQNPLQTINNSKVSDASGSDIEAVLTKA